jgi:hypothetical protein
MAEDGNQTRPVRTLTVKNFSVIKEGKLEFGKITVLIGPQASGKSLLCKLAYFAGRVVIELAMDHVSKTLGFSEFEAAVMLEFTRWFPQSGWGEGSWSIDYVSERYGISVSEIPTSELTSEPEISFCDAFRREYLERLVEASEEKQKKGFLLASDVQSRAATQLMKLAGRGVWDAATYIPLERSYFVDTQKGYRAIAPEVDPISARFAAVFADSLSREIPKPRLKRFLDGDLLYFPDGPAMSFRDGRVLPLGHLSGGGKETLPIISVLDMYEHRRRQSGPDLPSQELYGDKLYMFDDLTIEEPEASVFPATQYELVKDFVALANEMGFRPRFLITTHSPYILTSFNNLIEAGQAARNNPKLHDQIAKIVPEQYWIREGDFKAYAIEDGNLKSILNESGFVEGNYLDQVSETIGDEFDKLLRLEYEHTKAS